MRGQRFLVSFGAAIAVGRVVGILYTMGDTEVEAIRVPSEPG